MIPPHQVNGPSVCSRLCTGCGLPFGLDIFGSGLRGGWAWPSRVAHAASVAPPPPGDASGPSAPSAPASEAPCAAEAASNSDDDWDALLDAHGLARHPVALRPPSPSRPTPLELVGAPATSAAAVCARPPSALCGGRSDVLSPVLCALSAGVASSCGFVCFSVGAGLISGVCCVFSRPCSVVRDCP